MHGFEAELLIFRVHGGQEKNLRDLKANRHDVSDLYLSFNPLYDLFLQTLILQIQRAPPSNFTDAGRVMGLFELKNLVEAVILTLLALYLCLVFLPLDMTAKLVVTLSAIVSLGGFGLIRILSSPMLT